MKRSKHSLSHYKILSMKMGNLVPIACVEALPGDTIQHATSALVRTQPLLAPVMHPTEVAIHHWFVPHRLIWEDWEDFITGGPDGMDASEFPVLDTGVLNATGSLHDYLGIPVDPNNIITSALPFRAYGLIFNEFYRDQDLVSKVDISLASGLDTTTSQVLLNRAWEKDYFTSARPWTQKGPEVTIPLGTSAPVVRNGLTPTFNVAGSGLLNSQLRNDPTPNRLNLQGQGAAGLMTFGNESGLQTDLTLASAANINSLREAFALQRYEEARARYGSRYTEYLRYLGVKSADSRLQRPEYLGGGKQTIQFSEVLQTGVDATTGADSGIGNLKGHGIAALRSNRYRRFFEEHGYVITLMSVKPKTIYSQGIPRTFNRRTKEDFFQKELQHIGQQAILNKEIYAAHTAPEGNFGWQDRYDEYRRQESTIAGEFRNILNYWHMAREFSSEPTLNGSFVTSSPTTRVFPVEDNDTLYVMANHSMQARRLLDKSGASYIF